MIQQIFAVTMMNLRSLPARWGVAAVVVICLAGVSGVMVSMLAMADGFQKTFQSVGREDRVIVLTTGETYESGSSIRREQLPVLLAAPGLKHLADGKPAATVERINVAPLPLRKNGSDGNLVLRGVSETVWQVRPEVKLIEGRRPAAGLRELVVGRAAQGQFSGLDLGSTVDLGGVSWSVVGVFASGGSALESEAWSDVEVMMGAYSQTTYNSITALLESPASFTQYKDAVTANPELSHTPQLETQYYAGQGGTVALGMRVVGYVVASIMALGALFAAVNTMYASIEARSVEIATLRAIGFGAVPVVASVLLESVVLCGAGALCGGALAYLMFNGYTVSTLGGAAFSQIAFAFNVSPRLLVQGMTAACVIGLAGGIAPALSAARMPVAEALRGA